MHIEVDPNLERLGLSRKTLNPLWSQCCLSAYTEVGKLREATKRRMTAYGRNTGGSDLEWGRCLRHGVLLWSWWGSGCAPPYAAKSGLPLLGWQAEHSGKAKAWRWGQSCWEVPLHWERGDPPADRDHCAWSPCRSRCPSPCYPWRGCGLEWTIYLGGPHVLFIFKEVNLKSSLILALDACDRV